MLKEKKELIREMLNEMDSTKIIKNQYFSNIKDNELYVKEHWVCHIKNKKW